MHINEALDRGSNLVYISITNTVYGSLKLVRRIQAAVVPVHCMMSWSTKSMLWVTHRA